MSDRSEIEARIRERELGLRRQQRITRTVAAVAVGGSAVFTGLAATKSIPAAAHTTTHTRRTTHVSRTTTSETPDTVIPPSTPTVQTPSAPVTASGGS